MFRWWWWCPDDEVGEGGEWMPAPSRWASWYCCWIVERDGPGPFVLPVLALLANDEATEEAEEELDEDEVERRASEMLANVVRPQFGSTSSARLPICVVILSRRLVSCFAATSAL